MTTDNNQSSKKTNKTALRANQAISALLFFAAIVLLGWLSTQFKTEFDWTANQRNSLTTASVKQLGNMQGPVTVLAFAPSGPENRADTAQFFKRYSAVKKDLAVEFIDPPRCASSTSSRSATWCWSTTAGVKRCVPAT